MKCISLHQPWASAVARGLKRIETRSWMIYGSGPIAIHAAQKRTPELRRFFHQLADDSNLFRNEFFGAGGSEFDELPFGKIIAVGELVECVHMKFINFDKLTPLERALGVYTKDRWAWILKGVRPLKNPIPFKGKQGIFNVEL